MPTIISYDPSDKSSFSWGGQRHEHPKIEGLKLLFDTEQDTPLYITENNTEAELQKLGKSVIDVAADYISSIYTHAISVIETEVPSEYMQMCQKMFVVTVPADWSDKAKMATLSVREPVVIPGETVYSRV